MSRVDEARRRAEARNAPETVTPSATAQGIDPAGLRGDPFPEEPSPRGQVSVPMSPAVATIERRPLDRAVTAAPRRVDDSGAEIAEPLINRIDGVLSGKIVIDQSIMPVSREQYRKLGASLHHLQAQSGIKVIMISSAAPGEGKTLTAANLSLTLSESYRRSVLLVDADLRRPSMHTLFHVDNSSGLSEGLKSSIDRRMPVHQVTPRLAILPAGRPDADPMAGLTSDRMRRLVEEAGKMFDWVIIDTPPVGLLSDANLLAAMADGALMIVRAGSTPYELVRRAIDAIGRQKIVGVVLNRVEAASLATGATYYKEYYGSKVDVVRSA